MNKILLLFASAVAFSAATSALAISSNVLKSPQPGVLCDQYMCADAKGISKDLTEKFLGSSAAAKLLSQGAFDMTEFTFANGVFCDTKERACHKDRYFDTNGQRSQVDIETTRLLFGK